MNDLERLREALHWYESRPPDSDDTISGATAKVFVDAARRYLHLVEAESDHPAEGE